MNSTFVSTIVGVIGRLRAYVVGLVVWGLWLDAAGIQISDNGDVSGSDFFLQLAALPAYFATVAVVRTLWPLRMSLRGSSKLIGGGKSYRVHSFTGSVHSRSRDTRSTTTGTISTVDHGAYLGVEGQINTTHQTFDQFSLADIDGHQTTIQVKDAFVPLGDGQLMTAAWAIAPGRGHGPWIVFDNHSTQQTTYAPDGLYRIIFGGRVGFHVLWTLSGGLLMLLGGSGFGFAAMWVALLCFAFASRLQMALFRNVTSRRLIARLHDEGSAASAAAARREQQVAGPAASVPLPGWQPEAAPMGHPTQTPPPPPPAPAPPTVPASWQPDPHGRHEHRYWDGRAWTEHVSDAGVQGADQV